MGKTRPCAVCGKMTDKILFNDKILNIAICSIKCEYEHLHTLNPNAKEQMNVLRSIDDEIEKNKRRETMGWAIAGSGALLVAIGFFTSNVVAFLIGILPLTVGALSTSYFEDTRNKLLRLRKRIII